LILRSGRRLFSPQRTQVILTSNPIEEDHHLRLVLRYVERNPLRARLVERAEQWPWSSLARIADVLALDAGPVPRGAGWVEAVNAVMTAGECLAIRESIHRNRPLGSEAWMQATAVKLGLESSLRDRGSRPTKPTGEVTLDSK
jgi:putative transposase